MKKSILAILLLGITSWGIAQPIFTKADTLRGSLNDQRDWFDIMKYDITVQPFFETKSIKGNVTWTAKVIKASNDIQIDLQQPLIIDSIVYSANNSNQKNSSLSFTRDNNIAIANLTDHPAINTSFKLMIYYHGVPIEAIRPPWDGGWIWTKDANGKPWMTVACQGIGASAWYPCKDIQSDEPNHGASLTMIVPDTLMAIGNGRLKKQTKMNGLASFTWEVVNPINNYTIIPYIGDYVGWNEKYPGLKGDLDVHYWVLRESEAKAKSQFNQVPLMLKAFEYWMGPYPFYEDGYQLIQSSHLGMEHQSAVAYGNKFGNGYLGRDLSGSGWGKNWDYIIVHESGHEWFANNITTNDIADMWVHEGFTNYSEVLYVDYYYGAKAGNEYTNGIRRGIQNKFPIISHYGVNEKGNGDMYAKGANILQTIRHAINNDSLFRTILIGLNKDFYHQTVSTKQIENYISNKSNFNFTKVFDQYLRNPQMPTFNYNYDSTQKILTYQYKNCVVGFNLPINVSYNNSNITLLPMDYESKKRLINMDNFNVKEFVKLIQDNYYVKMEEGKF
ncbi:MAG: M1 family metallopeptidase [Chitinophagia bacterium]|jgi:aminopeptidase N